MHIFDSSVPFEDKPTNIFCVPPTPKYIEHRGYMYLVRSSAFPDHIKIGRTADLSKRLQAYNSDQPFNTFQPILVSHLFPDVLEVEAKILSYLTLNLISPTTLKHEWFESTHTDLLTSLITQAESHYGSWL